MAVFKCKMCGGTIEFNPGDTVGVCDSCGTKQTLPRLDDDRRTNLYDRANHFRRNNEFDKAAGIYEQILNEDTGDAEAYWSLVLCRYGIEYVEDPATRKRVPTVNRAQFTSIFDDDNYKSAIQYADNSQRTIYEEEANTINEIQKGILAISQKEDPFDVFICYKETDANGRRTQDSVLANELYHQLINEGFKVFFSRITLEDKLGIAYEPYIFAALNSAKVMVVLGTKPEHFNAVWVKNEWSRFLDIVKQSNGKKVLIPAFKDMDPYDLPDEFSHLQAQDMSKLGFMQDLLRGVKKIIEAEKTESIKKETIITNGSLSVEPLLERAFMFLEDGDWQKADEFCEQVLNIEPKNAKAYLGKLLSELHVHRQDDLVSVNEPFDNNSNYRKVVRFGSESLINQLDEYIQKIKNRNEDKRKENIYYRALSKMETAKSEADFKAAAQILYTISDYKDATFLADQCLKNADDCKKESLYQGAIEEKKKGLDANKMSLFDESSQYLASAVSLFEMIPEWKNSNEEIAICKKTILDNNVQAEAQKIELEYRQKRVVQIKKRILITVVCLGIVGVIIYYVLNNFIIPEKKYQRALSFLNATNYDAAATELVSIKQYKNSADLLETCDRGKKYVDAIEKYNNGYYAQALSEFLLVPDFNDAEEYIELCKRASLRQEIEGEINSISSQIWNKKNLDVALSRLDDIIPRAKEFEDLYDRANALYEQYLEELYGDSYRSGIEQYNAGEYENAINSFTESISYLDSQNMINSSINMIITNAQDYMKSSDYVSALSKLDYVIESSYSSENIIDKASKLHNECITRLIESGVEHYNAGEYSEAIDTFSIVKSINTDANEWLIKSYMTYAEILLKKGEYYDAAEYFSLAGNQEMYELARGKITKAELSRAKVGETINIGGKAWIVLYKNNTKIFVISRDSLGTNTFGSINISKNTSDSWENSSIRRSIKNIYDSIPIYETVFISESETSKGVTDYLFLPSANEIKKYVTSDIMEKYFMGNDVSKIAIWTRDDYKDYKNLQGDYYAVICEFCTTNKKTVFQQFTFLKKNTTKEWYSHNETQTHPVMWLDISR